jgi:tetratricopeptide (TPR) repeat protein
MRKIFSVVLAMVCVAMLAGCAKNEPVKAVDGKAQQLLREGTVYLKQGDVLKAVESFGVAIKTSPDYFEAYYMLAETFIHLKQFDQAQAVLTLAANRFPDKPVVYYLLAVAFEGSDKLMPAIVAARKSLDLFHANNDAEGEKRATILLGALVQMGKAQSEKNMVDNAAKDAARDVGAK